MAGPSSPPSLSKFQRFSLEIARIFLFAGRFFRELFTRPFEGRETLRQCYIIGYQTLALITFTGFIAGIVFTRQSRPSLESFGATSWLPSLIAIAFIRSLGPLLTSLIGAGKIASNIGAELGSMRVSEQIDAMEVSGINPFKFLVVTRVLATSLMIPTLVIYADFMGLLGSFVSVHTNDGTSFALFFVQVFESISLEDISVSVGKSFIFGFAIGIISCYKGYTASNGTVGVGKGANAAVVISMLLIFILDLIALQVQMIINPQ
jgi:phospholipid/cholesterol/gamma-HCH transport system permease protein